MLLRGAPSVTWRLAQATSRPQAAARLAQPATSPCLAQHHRQRCSLLPCGASGQRRRACRARSGAAPPAETQEPEAAAWGADDLQRLRQEDEIEEEDALGEEWRSLFEDQLEELYMYAEEEEEKWNMVQDALDNVPQAQWQVRRRRGAWAPSHAHRRRTRAQRTPAHAAMLRAHRAWACWRRPTC